jgi:transcriptional regulator GlxA family with amidase domain
MIETIGILLFDEMEELDFVGPWEVFAMATVDLPEVRVVSVAERAEPVRCWNGLRMLPDHAFGDAPDCDVLIVPGGMGTRREVENPVLLEWLSKAAARAEWVGSVCTGSLLLHGAGLTEGKRITTHWGFVPELKKRATEAEVLENVRYVRDGRLVTAAGVSAGIDMALWLVGQLWDVERARRAQRMMEYDPAPPYTAEV